MDVIQAFASFNNVLGLGARISVDNGLIATDRTLLASDERV